MSTTPLSQSVFVRGLPDGATDDQVSSAFSKFGAVLPSTKVFTDKAFAFVDFATEAAAQAAINAPRDSILVGDRTVIVSARREPPPPTIFVSPVPGDEASLGELRALIASSVGEPSSIRLSTKPNQNGAYFAFVVFPSQDMVNAAISQLDGSEFAGQTLTVQKSHSTQRSNAPGGGGGGRGPMGGGAGARTGGRGFAPRTGAPRRSGGPASSSSGGPRMGGGGGGARSRPSGGGSRAISGPTVHVGDVPLTATDADVRAAFEGFGIITNVLVNSLDDTKAFVEFDSVAAVQAAIAAGNAQQLGSLSVSQARNNANTVHVVGFSSVPTDQSLRDGFSKFGRIVGARVLKPAKYAFVSYAAPDAVARAVAQSGSVLVKGAPVKVEESSKSRAAGGQ